MARVGFSGDGSDNSRLANDGDLFIVERQGKADAFLDDLMRSVCETSPMKRRQFVGFLRNLGNLEFLYPLRQDDQKQAKLRL